MWSLESGGRSVVRGLHDQVAGLGVPNNFARPYRDKSMISVTSEFSSDSTAQLSARLTPPLPKPRLRGIALPIEHGSWGILFEPLVAAMAVAMTAAAPFIALLFVAAFLLRQPLRVWLADRAAGRDLPQTAAARKYAEIYFMLAVGGAIGSLAFARAESFLPLLLVMPLAAVQIKYDIERKSRRLLPELLGAIALSSSAAAIALSAGWQPAAAAALSLIFVLRMIPSIFYVRNRLLLEKGKQYSIAIPAGSHIFAFVISIVLTYFGLCSVLTAAMFAALLLRSSIGMSSYRIKQKAMQIGVTEVVFGALTVASVIVGHYTGF